MASKSVSEMTSDDQRPASSEGHRRDITGRVGIRRIESGARVSPKPGASGYSTYVGRIGALAVFLGVGAAIASMQ